MAARDGRRASHGQTTSTVFALRVVNTPALTSADILAFAFVASSKSSNLRRTWRRMPVAGFIPASRTISTRFAPV